MESEALERRRQQYIKDGDKDSYNKFLDEYWDKRIALTKKEIHHQEFIAWLEVQ